MTINNSIPNSIDHSGTNGITFYGSAKSKFDKRNKNENQFNENVVELNIHYYNSKNTRVKKIIESAIINLKNTAQKLYGRDSITEKNNRIEVFPIPENDKRIALRGQSGMRVIPDFKTGFKIGETINYPGTYIAIEELPQYLKETGFSKKEIEAYSFSFEQDNQPYILNGFRNENNTYRINASRTYVHCDIIKTNHKPRKSNLNQLAITCNAAYVRFKQDIFYVNKSRKICNLLSKDNEKIHSFDKKLKITLLSADQSRRLSDKELMYIRSILKHTVCGHWISTPNIEPISIVYEGWPYQFFMVVRPISPGDELLYDYGENYWKNIEVTANDFLCPRPKDNRAPFFSLPPNLPTASTATDPTTSEAQSSNALDNPRLLLRQPSTEVPGTSLLPNLPTTSLTTDPITNEAQPSNAPDNNPRPSPRQPFTEMPHASLLLNPLTIDTEISEEVVSGNPFWQLSTNHEMPSASFFPGCPTLTLPLLRQPIDEHSATPPALLDLPSIGTYSFLSAHLPLQTSFSALSNASVAMETQSSSNDPTILPPFDALNSVRETFIAAHSLLSLSTSAVKEATRLEPSQNEIQQGYHCKWTSGELTIKGYNKQILHGGESYFTPQGDALFTITESSEEKLHIFFDQSRILHFDQKKFDDPIYIKGIAKFIIITLKSTDQPIICFNKEVELLTTGQIQQPFHELELYSLNESIISRVLPA